MSEQLTEKQNVSETKSPITDKQVKEIGQNIKDSNDIAAKNEVYDIYDLLKQDKVSGLQRAQKIVEEMDAQKITPQIALKKMTELSVQLRTPFVPPAF